MSDQDWPVTPPRSLQRRLAEEVQASRLLMRERLSEARRVEPADRETGPSGKLGPLSRIFADLCN